MTQEPVAKVRRRRVPALAPDERRAALIAATLPLLREHGSAVTTRQIAEAAGVAEGTIFGVFPDKTSLLTATVLESLDPKPILSDLAGLVVVNPGRARELHERLRLATGMLIMRFDRNHALFAMLRTLPPESAKEVFATMVERRRLILDGLAKVIEPDAANLRRSPASTARLLLTLVFAASRDEIGDDEALTADEVVAVLLDGLLIRENRR